VNPEKKFWYEIKAFNLKNNCELSFTRVENTASWGTPDILGYNRNHHFFTVELKVTKTNKVRLSPHQIAFHVKHPLETFILVFDARDRLPKLYEGSRIRELAACGLKLDPRTQGWVSCSEFLSALGA